MWNLNQTDRGTHFTAEVMQEIWKLLGIKIMFHISYHSMVADMGQVDQVNQVDRINQTVVSMVKKCVATNQKGFFKTALSSDGS